MKESSVLSRERGINKCTVFTRAILLARRPSRVLYLFGSTWTKKKELSSLSMIECRGASYHRRSPTSFVDRCKFRPFMSPRFSQIGSLVLKPKILDPSIKLAVAMDRLRRCLISNPSINWMKYKFDQCPT